MIVSGTCFTTLQTQTGPSIFPSPRHVYKLLQDFHINNLKTHEATKHNEPWVSLTCIVPLFAVRNMAQPSYL